MQQRLAGVLILSLGLGCMVPAALAAAVEGRLITGDGRPVVGARAILLEDGSTTATDGRGRFSFPDAAPPAEVFLEHPRYTSARVLVEDGEDQLFELQPKQEIFEEIVVSATREAPGTYQPPSVPTSVITLEDHPTVPTTVVELVEGTPGVAENGQGGLFQAYSIRGIAGQRVMTLVAGARIVTERRAGATASFVDPLLLGRAEVVRGPFSSYYGSGAMGGLLQLFPRRFTTTTVVAGYESEGDQTYQQVGLGWHGWSLGLAHRQANDARAPDGERLFSRFDQWSASLARDWRLAGGSTLALVVLPSAGRDIGKPNIRFPEETTIYPQEKHLVTRLSLTTPRGWRFDLWAHPNELLTRDLEPDRRNLVDNDAFDYGVNALQQIELSGDLVARVGADYYGRRGVQATERSLDLETGAVDLSTTLDGLQDELGLYGSLQRSVGRVTLQGGGRFTWIQQQNAGAPTTTDTALTAFVGVTAPLPAGFELAANLGSGFRFPGLSERFFTGTTGRGDIVANQALDAETSVSLDLGVRYFGDRLHLALFGYRNEIDDYIERIELAPGVRSFVNLTSGSIDGIELDGLYHLTSGLGLSWAGHYARGEGDGGEPLSDIPQARLQLGLDWEKGAWSGDGRIEHRFSKDRIGGGERPVPSAELLSASVTYRFEHGLGVTVTGKNLLDETYRPSADDLAVPAPGRSLGLYLTWDGQ